MFSFQKNRTNARRRSVTSTRRLVVAADHRKALLLRNEGEVGQLHFRMYRTVEPADDTDFRGFKITFGLFGRSSRTVVRNHGDENTRSDSRSRYAHHLVDVLGDVVNVDRIESMAIVATPHLFGDLREHSDPPLRRLVLAEIDRDLVHQPLSEIEAKLTGCHLHKSSRSLIVIKTWRSESSNSSRPRPANS